MNLLYECAEKKVAPLQMFDEIEVYLQDPIMLRERLNLQINAKRCFISRAALLQSKTWMRQRHLLKKPFAMMTNGVPF